MKLGPQAESLYRVQVYGPKPAIEGVAEIELRRAGDDGGSMVELLRLPEPLAPALAGFVLAQVNYSTVEPGVVKAFHVHRRQTDVWFVPPEDRLLVVLADVRSGSPTEGNHQRLLQGAGRASLLRIPPGVAHGCRNVGDRPARIFYFTDTQFSPERDRCDEGRLPWDFLGPQMWDVAWE